MLNELKIIADEVSHFIPEKRHKALKIINGKGKSVYKVTVANNGNVSIMLMDNNICARHQYWSPDNQNSWPFVRLVYVEDIISEKKIMKRLSEFINVVHKMGDKKALNDLESLRGNISSCLHHVHNHIMDGLDSDGTEALLSGTSDVRLYFDSPGGNYTSDEFFNTLNASMKNVNADFIDLFGFSGTVVKKSFCKMNLPNIGSFSPWERNSDLKTFRSYGLQGYESFPLSSGFEDHIGKAIEWMSKNGAIHTCNNGNKTVITMFSPISGKCGEKELSNIIDIPVNMFSATPFTEKDEENEDKADSCRLAASAMKCLNGVEDPQTTVAMLCINKPTVGPASLSSVTNITVADMVERVAGWHEIMSRKNNNGISYAIKVLNRHWGQSAMENGGSTDYSYKKFSFSDLHSVIFNDDIEMAKMMIEHMAGSHAWLMANWASLKNVNMSQVYERSRGEINTAQPLAKYLLSKVGVTEPWKNEFYGMGKLYRHADRLHAKYNKIMERKECKYSYQNVLCIMSGYRHIISPSIVNMGDMIMYFKNDMMNSGNGDKDYLDLAKCIRFKSEKVPQNPIDKLCFAMGYLGWY